MTRPAPNGNRKNEKFYKTKPGLQVTQKAPYKYQLSNNKVKVTTKLKIELFPNVSIFRTLYNDTRLLDEAFESWVTREGSDWLVTVKGKVQECPGQL